MEFNDLNSAINYIKDQIPGVLNECSYDMQEIMINEIMKQIYEDHTPVEYNRTGQLMDTPQMVGIDNNSVTMEFVDNGDWRSVYEPHKHMNAFAEWEAGNVWGEGTNSSNGKYNYRPPTHIHEESTEKCKQEIPKKFKEYLRSRGITIE